MYVVQTTKPTTQPERLHTNLKDFFSFKPICLSGATNPLRQVGKGGLRESCQKSFLLSSGTDSENKGEGDLWFGTMKIKINPVRYL